jgi:type IV pilus assembly protein PilW
MDKLSIRYRKFCGYILENTMKKCDSSKGFTLVETLIALVIGTIIIGATLMASMAGQQAASGIEQKVDVQQDIRAALDLMVMEISMASYNPNADKTLIQWKSAGDCNAAGTTANRGIQQADGSNIAVEMDLNGDGNVTGSNEIIKYSYSGNRIRRSTSCGTNSTLIGNTNSAWVINDPGTPVFQYFDGNNNVTANIPDIRRIVVTLVVQSSTSDIKGVARTMVYSTSIIPRNHMMSIE